MFLFCQILTKTKAEMSADFAEKNKLSKKSQMSFTFGLFRSISIIFSYFETIYFLKLILYLIIEYYFLYFLK